jgi:hypothetical protein
VAARQDGPAIGEPVIKGEAGDPCHGREAKSKSGP